MILFLEKSFNYLIIENYEQLKISNNLLLKKHAVYRVSSAKSSIESAGLIGTAERSFLTPKTSRDLEPNVPSLDEFDAEIDIYRVSS